MGLILSKTYLGTTFSNAYHKILRSSIEETGIDNDSNKLYKIEMQIATYTTNVKEYICENRNYIFNDIPLTSCNYEGFYTLLKTHSDFLLAINA